MNPSIGPCLPPHLQDQAGRNEDDAIGPSLPPHLQGTIARDGVSENGVQKVTIGPALPPHLHPKADEETEPSDDSPRIIGPALPPRLKGDEEDSGDSKAARTDVQEEDSFGPALPPGLQKKKTIGPTMPSQSDLMNAASLNEDDDDIIGPLPPPSGGTQSDTVADEFERRAKKMKDRLTGNEKPKKLEREEWMTELPPLLQGFGGGPRKFRVREKNEIGDRSVWTDTPADKAKRAAMGSSAKMQTDEERLNAEVIAKRDAEIASKLESERGESLMTMHEKSRKRKLEEDKKSGEANIRRPFDRDLDLQVLVIPSLFRAVHTPASDANKFDEATRKRMLKKSQGLSNRFSHGASSAKFL